MNPLQINGHRVSAGKVRRTARSNAATVNAPTAPDRITAERVAMSIRTRFDPLPALNPRSLTQILQQFEYGYLETAARTFDAMERRDDRLASVAGKAKSALARYGFEVLVAGGNLTGAQKAEAQRHQAALEYFYTHCTATNAVREDETGGFSLLVRQMADAIGKRYSVHEIVWEPGDGGTLTATFRHAPLWFFEAITGRLRYKPQDGAAAGVPMDPDAWLVTVGDGIMEACAVLWMFKHLPLRDWLAYSEKFGMPYLLGKTGAAFNSAEWNAMAAALRGFGSDGAAVIGGGDDIVPVQAGVGSEETPFPGLIERSDRAMSILWRGADLGTQSHGGAGRGQGASLQEDETAALDEDRAAWLTESLLPVSRTAIRYLFGPGVKPLAYVRIKTRARRDIQLDLAVDAFLLNNGAPVALADALERYGRPLPGPGEALLHPASGGGAKGAAAEDTTEASLERAANQEADGHWITKDGHPIFIGGTSGIKSYDGKLSSHPYKQDSHTGHCGPAILSEAFAQLSKMTGAEQSWSVPEIEDALRKKFPRSNFNFSDAQSKNAPSVQDLADVLKDKGMASVDLSRRIGDQSGIDQIADHLKDGPVMVATYHGGNEHGELIMKKNDDGSYATYNPQSKSQDSTLLPSDIDPKGVIALSPILPGSTKSHPSTAPGSRSGHHY